MSNLRFRMPAIVVGLLVTGGLASCAKNPTWTPYEQPPPKTVGGVEVYARDAAVVKAENASCTGCHAGVQEPHGKGDAVPIGCVDCHGGNGRVFDKDEAHPTPHHPEYWEGRGGANPERAYTEFLHEGQDWVRFVNPGDLRVANETCGGCHPKETLNVKKSIMTTSAHFFGVASYANGITSNKRTIFGESYSPEGLPQVVWTLVRDEKTGRWRWPTDEEVESNSYARLAAPIPHWEVAQTANIFRTFEQGSRLGTAAAGFNGTPVPIIGLPDKLEDPGRPNNKGSDRGLGTLNRTDNPLLNLQKTRLNDPHLSFLGTNDQPGDYRSSGCTACHMIYANDRDPLHSGPYAKFGNRGHGNLGESPFGNDNRNATDGSQNRKFNDSWPVDPALAAFNGPARDDVYDPRAGHPLTHSFTTSIPSSQCMVCHMHQPNAFVNPFYGYQMWTYETDGQEMWPEEQEYPSHSEWFERVMRNPEGAAVKGKWGEREFLDDVSSLNPKLEHTQFSDYHGHGWVFRAVFKMDKKGNLLDKDGEIVPYDDPKKFEGVIPELATDVADLYPKVDGKPDWSKGPDLSIFSPKSGHPVHLKDIHLELGMHCVDCHFENDVHGNGMVYAEYQAAVEIRCHDCHGTTDDHAHLTTSGPASKAGRDKANYASHGARDEGGSLDLAAWGKTPWGAPRFEKKDGKFLQRSMIYPGLDWEISQVKDTVTPGHEQFNERAYKAKMLEVGGCKAHSEDKMECYTCHTAWMTSCFGCHLPQKANWKTTINHFEGTELRNFASYNPQVARDEFFMLGVAPNVKGNAIATVRSSSAVLISVEDAQRRILYPQVPTIATSGMSSQLLNTHFSHAVRKTETRTCTECHLSAGNDNNAWMAQLFLQGTNYVNFMGYHAYAGRESGFVAVRVTEWEEPQAVIGSNLQRMAYPDHYQDHLDRGREIAVGIQHPEPYWLGGHRIRSLQLRGEYLLTAGEEGGFRAYDVANVANKDFAEKIVTQPFSPLGHNTHVKTKFATAVALPTNNHINMSREYRPENKETGYSYRGKIQNMHELYRYAYVSDRYEGLIVIDIDTLSNWEPRDNFLSRAVTFNPDGILDGAENLTVAGTTVYVCCHRGIVAVDIDDPLEPKVIAEVGSPDVSKPTAIEVQFRYAFVTDETGLVVLDITEPGKMKAVPGARVALGDARGLYLARSYAYVAGGAEGLVIVDVQDPTEPKLVQKYTADGKISDLHQVKVAMTYVSLYAYLADGKNGLHVVQLVTPEDGGRSAYGFAPEPRPKLIATYPSGSPIVAVGEGLDRDRGVDESGHQMTAFGRIGGRPLNLEEQRRFYVRDGRLYRVDNDGRVWEEGSRGELTPVKDLYPHEGTAPPDAMMKR